MKDPLTALVESLQEQIDDLRLIIGIQGEMIKYLATAIDEVLLSTDIDGSVRKMLSEKSSSVKEKMKELFEEDIRRL